MFLMNFLKGIGIGIANVIPGGKCGAPQCGCVFYRRGGAEYGIYQLPAHHERGHQPGIHV